jgi:hypothetical protein
MAGLSRRDISGIKEQFNIIEKFQDFNEQPMKSFNYKLYEKSFPWLNRACKFMPEGSTEEQSISFKYIVEITS